MKSAAAIHRLLLLSQLFSWLVIAVLAYTLYQSRNTSPDQFDVINARRLNIVNDDGTTVIAIANKQTIAEPRVNGRAYPVEMIEREHFAGMIFFNELGDEMGGLIFNSSQLEDGRSYGAGHLSFDRFNDNQVINLEYQENIRGSVKSGLTFYDRTGDGSFGRQLDLLYEYWRDDTPDDRKQAAMEEMESIRSSGSLGAERLFIGSDNNIPQLTMKDMQGRTRVRLLVEEQGQAQLQFLDQEGMVTAVFPPE